MDGIIYRKAGIRDLDLLVELRSEVLCAANCLPEDTDMSAVKVNTGNYLRQHMEDDTSVTWLAYAGGRPAGCGSVSFFEVMPVYHNPSGWKAYIMNMYTVPAFRRKGIARAILNLLVQEAENRGITQISLEATDMGRPLYEACGFRQMSSEMELKYSGRGSC